MVPTATQLTQKWSLFFPGHAVWTSAAGWCVSSVMTWVRRHCLDIQPHHYVYTPPVSSGGWQPLPGNTAAVAAVYWVQVSVGCPDCRACRHWTYSSGCCSCECWMVVLTAGPVDSAYVAEGSQEGGRERREEVSHRVLGLSTDLFPHGFRPIAPVAWLWCGVNTCPSDIVLL